MMRAANRLQPVEISEMLDSVLADGVLKGSTSLLIFHWLPKDELVIYGIVDGCVFFYTKAFPAGHGQ